MTTPFVFRGEPPAKSEAPFVFSVSGILNRMRRQLEGEYGDALVGGEISSFQIHPSSGHAYFALKDQRAKLTCVMWKDSLDKLRFRPQRGHEVIVRGRVTIFERGGQMQMNVTDVEPRGAGALLLEFNQRLEKLRAEGLTDPRRKRRIPPFPRRIGIVTSPGGAALRDVLMTILRRDPLAHVILSPAQVQGRSSASSIVNAIQSLDALSAAEVIILARGGGSLEDLWAFNEEPVARAIAACTVPVVTGVGHETDTTIADLVADLRASTPTAAAELVVPRRSDLEERLAELSRRIDGGLRRCLDHLARRLLSSERGLSDPTRTIGHRAKDLERLEAAAERAIGRLIGETARRLTEAERRIAERAPELMVARAHHRLQAFGARTEDGIRRRVERSRSRLAVLAGRLESMSPLRVLARGYALVEDESGAVVSRSDDVSIDSRLTIRLAEGRIRVRVEEKT